MYSIPNGSDAEALFPRSDNSVVASMPTSNESTNYQQGSVELSTPVESSTPVEFSTPLETAVPLEDPRFIYHVPPSPSVSIPPERQRAAQAIDEIIIPLLEERLVVDRRKRKVGEVVVRKEIETYIVEVPVRREKLIVEQVSPDYKQLAVVDLEQSQDQKTSRLDSSHPSTVSASFTSADAAVEFLEAIAIRPGSTTIQVSVALTDKNIQAAYQNWLKQHST